MGGDHRRHGRDRIGVEPHRHRQLGGRFGGCHGGFEGGVGLGRQVREGRDAGRSPRLVQLGAAEHAVSGAVHDVELTGDDVDELADPHRRAVGSGEVALVDELPVRRRAALGAGQVGARGVHWRGGSSRHWSRQTTARRQQGRQEQRGADPPGRYGRLHRSGH